MAREPAPSARDLIARGNALLEELLRAVRDGFGDLRRRADRTDQRLDQLAERVAEQSGQLTAVQLHGEAQAMRVTPPPAAAARADATGPIVIESTTAPGPREQTRQGPPHPPPVPITGPHVTPPLHVEDVDRAARTLGAWAWARRSAIAGTVRRIVAWAPAALAAVAAAAALLYRLCGLPLPPALRERERNGGLGPQAPQYADADEDGKDKGKKPPPPPDEKKKRNPPPTPDPKRDRRVQPNEGGERTAIDGAGDYEDTACDGGPREPERCGPK